MRRTCEGCQGSRVEVAERDRYGYAVAWQPCTDCGGTGREPEDCAETRCACGVPVSKCECRAGCDCQGCGK